MVAVVTHVQGVHLLFLVDAPRGLSTAVVGDGPALLLTLRFLRAEIRHIVGCSVGATAFAFIEIKRSVF